MNHWEVYLLQNIEHVLIDILKTLPAIFKLKKFPTYQQAEYKKDDLICLTITSPKNGRVTRLSSKRFTQTFCVRLFEFYPLLARAGKRM